MNVILNSDVIHTNDLIRQRLPRELESLCRACGDSNITIVVPLTTLLEFDRAQAKNLKDSITAVQQAYAVLADFGLPHQKVDPATALKPPDLVRLMRRLGTDVEVLNPTMDDYNEAHRRACLHEPPQPPDTKTDEMRDLVIWMLSIRVASQRGGALPVSRDTVHIHTRGDEEAKRAGLHRVDSLGRALEFLNVTETPAGALVKQLLHAVWDDLIRVDLPVGPRTALRGLKNITLTQGERGLARARFQISTQGPGGVLEATTEIMVNGARITEVNLSNIKVSGVAYERQSVGIRPNVPVDLPGTPYEERIRALKETLMLFGGQEEGVPRVVEM